MRPPKDEIESWRESLVEMPRLWAWITIKEWRSRTAFGKALFPFWFAESAIQWAGALFFLAFMLISMWLFGELDGPSEVETSVLPATHKDRS